MLRRSPMLCAIPVRVVSGPNSAVSTWGGNNRTHLIRVPDGNRIEPRGGDGSGVAVSVDHHALQHVQELGAGVLEEREHLAGLGQGDQERLDPLVLATQ